MSKLSRLFFRRSQRKPAALAIARGYDGAKVDRLVDGWSGDYGVSSYDIMSQLPIIRNRCRELAKNDPYMVKFLTMLRNNVVGFAGVKLSMNVAEWANGKRVPDMMASDIIERDFQTWAESPDLCDAEGKKTLTEILWRAVESWAREGEAILQMLPGHGFPANPFGFALKIRRADSLAITLIDARKGIYNGVEVDSYGRPIAYHFYSTLQPNGMFGGAIVRVPADQILHLYNEEYEGQTRGFPLMASVIRALKMAHAYDEAELVAARVDASRTGTYQAAAGSVDPADVADPNSGVFQMTVEPGEARISPIGYEYRPDAPTRPNSGYGQYKKDVLRGIAAGLAVSYNIWANDLEGVSYSSIRAGTLEDRESYKCLQAMVINHLVRPMFRRQSGWLQAYLVSGYSPLPFSKRAKFANADTWLPRRWEWVDPVSEAQAREIAVRHGWTTDSQIAAEMGKDFFDNCEEVKTETAWTAGTPLDARFAKAVTMPAPTAAQPAATPAAQPAAQPAA